MFHLFITTDTTPARLFLESRRHVNLVLAGVRVGFCLLLKRISGARVSDSLPLSQPPLRRLRQTRDDSKLPDDHGEENAGDGFDCIDSRRPKQLLFVRIQAINV